MQVFLAYCYGKTFIFNCLQEGRRYPNYLNRIIIPDDIFKVCTIMSFSDTGHCYCFVAMLTTNRLGATDLTSII